MLSHEAARAVLKGAFYVSVILMLSLAERYAAAWFPHKESVFEKMLGAFLGPPLAALQGLFCRAGLALISPVALDRLVCAGVLLLLGRFFAVAFIMP